MKFPAIIQAIRPFSLVTNIFPFVILILIALYTHTNISLLYSLLTIIAVLFIQSGCNILNEYYDFVNGIDTKDPLKYDRVLVESKIQPVILKKTGIIFFIIAILVSIPLVHERGVAIGIIGMIGIIGGYTYTGKNWGYKYYGLGDIFVFLLMGPLMVIGMYLGITGSMNLTVIWISIPIGFLISGILQSNNIRDMEYDSLVSIKTLAIYIGKSKAIKLYASMFIGSYVIIITMIFMRILPLSCLLVLFTIPMSYKLVNKIYCASDFALLKSIDEETAKVFTVIMTSLCIGIILGVIYAI
jgi:1,4-dihydroxy-2-naphthoate polyprenyltransferase